MYETYFPKKRYRYTLNFVKKHILKNSNILDLGVKNPLSLQLISEGYNLKNTDGEDLDKNIKAVKDKTVDVITAFEIIEHLVAPYNLLCSIEAKKLIATIPLRLWFAKAYRNPKDPRDNHFHEFEDWQFDWLLEKAGWKIIDRKKWTNPTKKIGIRPLLRCITPRYYAVYAERA